MSAGFNCKTTLFQINPYLGISIHSMGNYRVSQSQGKAGSWLFPLPPPPERPPENPSREQYCFACLVCLTTLVSSPFSESAYISLPVPLSSSPPFLSFVFSVLKSTLTEQDYGRPDLPISVSWLIHLCRMKHLRGRIWHSSYDTILEHQYLISEGLVQILVQWTSWMLD